MPTQRIAGAVFLLLLSCSLAQAQSAAPPKAAKDFSQEPFVVERYCTSIRFEGDGTGTRDLRVQIKVQSDAGVQQLGELVFGYSSENERMDVVYVRVRKADGSVVTAAPDAVKDLTAPVARTAPIYTDYREKHISVPALRPGETLEYEILTHVEKPLAPGQFWYEHRFMEGAVVLDEQLEINVPQDREIKIKTRPGEEPKVSTEAGRRVYRWRKAHLETPVEEAKKKPASRKPAPPDVQLTTFSSWEEVARWYAGLERDRAVPTPAIRAKAEELIQGRSDETAKIEALYDYVSKNIRYVSLSFGLGRYQPHAAEEILRDQYGDCKDKHTLLAALLSSVGVPADAVLIPYARKLDPDLPSPSQFDHVISAVPMGNDLLWMDTTAEVAPFRLLLPALRDKQALLVPPDGAGRLVTTPADPPFLSTQSVQITGQVSELGKLTAHLRYVLRGDNEFALRAAFRRTPQSQWKQLAQTIATLDGLDGEVTEVKASDPAAIHDPFELDLEISKPNFLDWTSKRAKLALPLPGLGMPNADEDSTQPIKLGSPLDVNIVLKLTLPESYSAQTPIGVSVTRDYAEYRSSYTVRRNAVAAERTLRFKARELPADRAADYLAFARAVAADEAQTLAVENSITGTPQIPSTAKAEELLEAGNAALQGGNPRTAIRLFERVVELEPKHKRAWNSLGIAYLRLGEFDRAAAAFRAQIQVNPYDENSYNYLGIALSQEQKYDDAAAAFQKQIEVNPLDKVAHAALGGIDLEQRKYAEAARELEKAAVLAPDNAELQVSLGRAYLELGQAEKALAAFDKGAQLNSSPVIWNNIAYQLALHRLQLDRAQRYAESAIEATAANLRNTDLEHLTIGNLQAASSLAAYWDTLGWIDFVRGDLDRAEPLIRAAWLLDQHGEVGDHLGQIYEKRGRRDDAIHVYALALVATRPVPETRKRLAALLRSDSGIEALEKKAAAELKSMRTIPLGKLPGGPAEAQFFVLLAAGPGHPVVEGVKFIGGSDRLQGFAEKLREANYPFVFPAGSPTTKLVLRGALVCASATEECAFTLDLPEKVFSVN